LAKHRQMCATKDSHTETADLLRKHGGKTKKELEASW